MPSPRRFPHQNRSPRRATAWGLGPSTAGGTITASGVRLWEVGSTLIAEQKATIVRTRGIISANIQGPGGADGDGYQGAHAIGIVTTDAFAAAAVPTPIADIDWPGWLWYQHFDVTDPDVTFSSDLQWQREVIDSKAMRKFGNNEILFGVSEFVEVGAAVLEIRADTRVLFKLS